MEHCKVHKNDRLEELNLNPKKKKKSFNQSLKVMERMII